MIGRVEEALRADRRDACGRGLLQEIPGVGIRTAEAVMAYVDDPHRFHSVKAIGSYFGLVPCQDQSAGKNRLGHITRQGPSTVRKLLTEASWQAIRRSQEIRAYFERIRQGNPERKKSRWSPRRTISCASCSPCCGPEKSGAPKRHRTSKKTKRHLEEKRRTREDCEDGKRDRTAGPRWGHGDVKAAFVTGAGPNSIAWRVETTMPNRCLGNPANVPFPT